MTPPRRAVLAAVVLSCGLVAGAGRGGAAAVGPPGGAGADDGARAAGDRALARELLVRSNEAAGSHPHVGVVTVVGLGSGGPRIATLAVRVGAGGRTELRRGTQWVLRSPGATGMRGEQGPSLVTPRGGAAPLDVDAVLAGRAVDVGQQVVLDTGAAVPVALRRTTGAPVTETLHLDVATGMLVRRETRDGAGQVLRVVAYTEMSPVAPMGQGLVARPSAPSSPALLAEPVALPTVPATAPAAGAATPLPATLPGGFTRVEQDRAGAATAAHYSDGLSALSLYRQDGVLDADGPGLAGAEVLHVADRDVWAWPGTEPVRLVWTGGGHTWTAVTDAPLPVVRDAVGALPGEMVAHDVPSRLLRGAERARGWFTGLLDRN